MPEWGFNGIGNLTPHQGYQIKSNNPFSYRFCDVTFSIPQSYLEFPEEALVELNEGWNTIGFSCPTPMDVEDELESIVEQVIIVKNNDGKAYLAEWNFNGIGDFLPQKGYQMKLNSKVHDFTFCSEYPVYVFNHFDFGCTDSSALNFDPYALHDNSTCSYVVYEGCTDDLACNYSQHANFNDNSCLYADSGFDCNGSPCYYPTNHSLLNNLNIYYPRLIYQNDCISTGSASEYETLKIKHYSGVYFDGLELFTNLNHLIIEDSYFDNLSHLPNSLNIVSLEISENNSLKHFSQIPQNVEELFIKDNFRIESITFPSDSNSLTHLTIENNHQLNQIFDVSNLHNLTHLEINNNINLRELPDLGGLSQLTNLKITNNNLLSTPNLSGLNNLTYIEISGN